MENENETLKSENENIEPQGTTEAPATGSLDVDESESTEEIKPSVSVEELQAQIETERKERQKIEMERNQLKNKQEEERKKALEEQGNWKQIAEEKEAELEALRQADEFEKNQQVVKELRDSIIDKYPNETVRKAAKALVEADPYNLVWREDVETEQEAANQINAQLDKLATTLGVQDENPNQTEDEPYVHPNNPISDGGDVTLEKLKNMSSKEMKKFLPTAEPR